MSSVAAAVVPTGGLTLLFLRYLYLVSAIDASTASHSIKHHNALSK